MQLRSPSIFAQWSNSILNFIKGYVNNGLYPCPTTMTGKTRA